MIMGNISIKLNLAGLKHAVRKEKGKTGEVECLIIPIEANNLYRGEKGMYLDLQASEIKNKREGSKDTHLVKQSLPKEVYSAMSDEDKKAMPILGNAILWGGSSYSNEAAVVEVDDDSDLPF